MFVKHRNVFVNAAHSTFEGFKIGVANEFHQEVSAKILVDAGEDKKEEIRNAGVVVTMPQVLEHSIRIILKLLYSGI